MVPSRFMLAGFAAIPFTLALAAEDEVFAALLRRQAPGTPEYNCHDNCGTALTISKTSLDVCKDSAFVTDYANCLQCAGPDNDNIWQYYGRSLSRVGETCGLATEPLSGEQEDVGPAVAASAASSIVTPASSTISTSSSEVPGSSVKMTETETETVFSSAPTTVPTVTEPVTMSSSGVPSPSKNGTVTVSSPPQQTTNAALRLEHSFLSGVIVMGLLYDLGN